MIYLECSTVTTFLDIVTATRLGDLCGVERRKRIDFLGCYLLSMMFRLMCAE